MVSDQGLYEVRVNFAMRLSLLIRMVKIFNPENATIDRQLKKCLHFIWAVSEREKRLSLKVLMDAVFVNEERVRVSTGTYQSIKLVIDELREKMIGEVLFMEGVSLEDLKGFLYLLVENEWEAEDGRHQLTNELMKKNINSIAVKPIDRNSTDVKRGNREAKKTYFRSIALVKEACQSLLEDKPLPLRKTKRLIQSMVDLVLCDKAGLHGLSTIKNYDDYTYNHSVNVSIYSITLGTRLGFSKKLLAEIGLVGLFHDLGKVKVPEAILKKPDKLSDVEWEVVKSHPMVGTEEILECREFAAMHPRILFGIFDHHLSFDISGYPRLKRKKKQTLFGRIITIADVYDALTSPRCYRKEPYSPLDALKLMWKECGVHFDPTLFKVFINAIGIYPIGTLIQLNTEELGIVHKANPSPKLLDRPTVLTVAKEEANRRTIDLSKKDERTGGFKRSIVRCLDPKKYNICVQEYFL